MSLSLHFCVPCWCRRTEWPFELFSLHAVSALSNTLGQRCSCHFHSVDLCSISLLRARGSNFWGGCRRSLKRLKLDFLNLRAQNFFFFWCIFCMFLQVLHFFVDADSATGDSNCKVTWASYRSLPVHFVRRSYPVVADRIASWKRQSKPREWRRPFLVRVSGVIFLPLKWRRPSCKLIFSIFSLWQILWFFLPNPTSLASWLRCTEPITQIYLFCFKDYSFSWQINSAVSFNRRRRVLYVLPNDATILPRTTALKRLLATSLVRTHESFKLPSSAHWRNPTDAEPQNWTILSPTSINTQLCRTQPH